MTPCHTVYMCMKTLKSFSCFGFDCTIRYHTNLRQVIGMLGSDKLVLKEILGGTTQLVLSSNNCQETSPNSHDNISWNVMIWFGGAGDSCSCHCSALRTDAKMRRRRIEIIVLSS